MNTRRHAVRDACRDYHQAVAERVLLDMARAIGLPAWQLFTLKPRTTRVRRARDLACWIACQVADCGPQAKGIAAAFGTWPSRTGHKFRDAGKRIDAGDRTTLATLRVFFAASAGRYDGVAGRVAA